MRAYRRDLLLASTADHADIRPEIANHVIVGYPLLSARRISRDVTRFIRRVGCTGQFFGLGACSFPQITLKHKATVGANP